MSNNTPGPWLLTDCGKHRPGEKAWKSCAHIATIDGPLPVTLANMQLKAAAPLLLAACEQALRESGCDGDLCCHEWHDVVRKAIAVAKGEAE
jgi:hypothetical protein